MDFIERVTNIYAPLCDQVTVTRTKDFPEASSLDVFFDVSLTSGDETTEHQFRESDLLMWEAQGVLWSKLVYED